MRVSIRDRGIGIPAEEQSRIFEEFHRASNVAGSQAAGFGLGMAVVKELVDRYGGRIELESAVGVGTTVRVRFPTKSSSGNASVGPRSTEGSPGEEARTRPIDGERR